MMCFPSRLQRGNRHPENTSDLKTSQGHGLCRNCPSTLKDQRNTAFTVRSFEIGPACTRQYRRHPISVHRDEAKVKKNLKIALKVNRKAPFLFSFINLHSFVCIWSCLAQVILGSHSVKLLWWKKREIQADIKKKSDISLSRTWNPFSGISRVSYSNVTASDRLTALLLSRCRFIYEHPWNHGAVYGGVSLRPRNVLLIIKGSHLAENDPAEEITGLGFLTNTVGFDCNWLFSLCPGVTGE